MNRSTNWVNRDALEAITSDKAMTLDKALFTKADRAAVLSLLSHTVVIVASGGAAVGFFLLKAKSKSAALQVVADNRQSAARVEAVANVTSFA